MRRPQNGISCFMKIHFSSFRVSPAPSILFKILGRIFWWCSNVLVLIMTLSCITWASQNSLNNGQRAFVNSPDAGLEPIVRCQYLIKQFPAWKAVICHDSWVILIWWKADLKSSLLKYLQPERLAQMSLALGIGMFVERIALLASLMLTARCVPLSSLGAKTGFDIQGAGPVCSSIMPAVSILAILFLKWSCKWNGIRAGWGSNWQYIFINMEFWCEII